MPRDPRLDHPDQRLIGEPGSRARLTTPALLLDLDRLMDNLATMAVHCRDRGVALRPHSKTHKSHAVAGLQLQYGAAGICCATLGEAAVMVAAGIPGVLLTSPVVGAGKLERLAALNRQAERLAVVADHPAGVAALAAAVGEGPPLAVLVDVDIGQHRTGVATAAAAVALAADIAARPQLRFAGVQGYGGHLQHIRNYTDRAAAARAAAAVLAGVVAALEAAGFAVPLITGGGTGTFDIDAGGGVFTELQAGSYAVMDVDYNRVALVPGANRPPFATALFVQCTVVSTGPDGRVATDAGLKRFATDGPLPEVAAGAPAGTLYRFQGDEHGGLVCLPGTVPPPLGSVVECVVPHCDPTINLYDVYHCVRGDTLVDLWPVSARGAV